MRKDISYKCVEMFHIHSFHNAIDREWILSITYLGSKR